MFRFRIFTASPGDVNEERSLLSEVVIPELQRIFKIPDFVGDGLGIDLESVRWETHSWPDIGEDAQDVINRQIGDLDIFVGIMWKRFGTPTGRAASGTGEEFDRAFELYESLGKPRIMFYFRTTEFYMDTLDEVEQFKKVLEFKARLENLGVRYWSYNSPLEFERFVREHLIRQIFDQLGPRTEVKDEGQSPARSSEEKPKAETREASTAGTEVSGKPRVFISYAREDAEPAKRLYEGLKNVGVEPWMDLEDLLPGQRWKEVIGEAIQQSQYFVAVLSRNSINKQGYVQRELRVALDILETLPESQLFVIPVRLDDFQPADERLRELNWVDMFPAWEPGMMKIVDTIILASRFRGLVQDDDE